MLGAWTPGLPEILIVAALVMLLFGAKKLPEMARSLGQSSKEFKKGLAEHDDEDSSDSKKATEAKAKETKTDETKD